MSKAMRSNVIFSATLYGRREGMWEVVITDDESVVYTHRPPGTTHHRTEQLDLPWRDVSDLLWELEDNVLSQWEKRRYGTGDVGEPGYWMIMLERDRSLYKWEGFTQYPPKWDTFIRKLEETMDRPFGVDNTVSW